MPPTQPTPKFLGHVLRLVAHPIFVKDREHRWVWVNDAFASLVGVPPEVLFGKTDHDYFPAAQADVFHTKDREVFQSGATVTNEEPITDVHAQTHWLATTKVPLRGPTGEITHIIGIIHDITRVKTGEDALRLANDVLENRVEERTQALRSAQSALLRKDRLVLLGQLSGGLAHQIRTPLAAISNAVAVVRRNLADAPSPETRQALAIMGEEIWEANRIITDLVDFARVRPPSLDAVSVSMLVDGALATVRPPTTVTVTTQVPVDLLAHVDERQMRDALGNVLRNALEAMPEGGAITVTATSVDDQACISIADTGPGINDDALVHLFEPLVTTKSLGLGLGLSTAKVLIENQRGEVRYVTSTGGGARFEIRVPLAP